MKFISYALVLFLALSIVTTGCTSKKEAVDNQETSITETTKENVEETEEDEDTETSENNDDDYEVTFNTGDDEDEGRVSMNAGKNTQWPKDIPSFFPKLNGKVVTVLETTEGDLVNYTVFFDEIKSEDMDSFAKKIEAKPGWKIISKNQSDGMWMIMAMNEKNEARLIATVEDGASGGLTITFNR
jgi:hypothetical protein